MRYLQKKEKKTPNTSPLKKQKETNLKNVEKNLEQKSHPGHC